MVMGESDSELLRQLGVIGLVHVVEDAAAGHFHLAGGGENS